VVVNVAVDVTPLRLTRAGTARYLRNLLDRVPARTVAFGGDTRGGVLARELWWYPLELSRLRDADVPQRFEFPDLDMVVNIRAAGEGEDGNLQWEWTDDVDWKPKVRMRMDSAICNKYFQGRENVAMAIARRRIKTGGDVKAALALIPITKPIYERVRALVADEYPHLTV